MNDYACVIVLTTMPSEDGALQFAATLVEERLAACVNGLPEMRSIYRWEGRVQQNAEHQVVIKTTTARLSALRTRLEALHPYDVPELIEISVSDGGEAYLNWVGDSVG